MTLFNDLHLNISLFLNHVLFSIDQRIVNIKVDGLVFGLALK